MKDFAYECPTTIEEAVAAMRADGARALAGGTDLIPQLREGRRQAGRIVDLKRIPELTAISALPDGGIAIGAAANVTSVARHAAVAAGYPAVAQSARLIGSLQVQNRASLGGNICNAAPSADAVPALICHQARARDRRARAGGARRPSRRCSAAPARPALDAGRDSGRDRAAAAAAALGGQHTCASRRAARWTSPSRAPRAWLRLDADGRDRRGAHRAGLGRADADPCACRRAAACAESGPRARCSRRPAGSPPAMRRPISDTRGSADYRRSLVAVLTARALWPTAARRSMLEVEHA